MALHALFTPLQVREVKLAPAHAVTADAVIHPLGVGKPVGQRVVQPVIVVDAYVGTPLGSARRFRSSAGGFSWKRPESGGNALNGRKADQTCSDVQTPKTGNDWRCVAAKVAAGTAFPRAPISPGYRNYNSCRALLDMTPYGRQQEFEDSLPGWPQKPTYG